MIQMCTNSSIYTYVHVIIIMNVNFFLRQARAFPFNAVAVVVVAADL